MSTGNTTRIGKYTLIAVLAGFAAQAGAAGLSADAVDTQDKVAALVSGAHEDVNVPYASSVRAAGTYAPGNYEADAPVAVTDTQERTRQLLLGINSSSVGGSRESDTSVSSTRPSIGTNGLSSGEALKLTQALVLGRAAS